MKKIDLGQTITILANLGVIAGIAFLAVEINQNNAQLAAQGRNSMYQMQSEIQRDFIANVGESIGVLPNPLDQDVRVYVPGGSTGRTRVSAFNGQRFQFS